MEGFNLKSLLMAAIFAILTCVSHCINPVAMRVVKDGSIVAMNALRPAVTNAMLSMYSSDSGLRGGSSFTSSSSCDDFLQSDHDHELHQQLVALGGVDITSIIRRQPSCEELRNYLLPLVGRNARQLNMK